MSKWEGEKMGRRGKGDRKGVGGEGARGKKKVGR